MKKTAMIFLVVATGNLLFSQCSMRMFEGRTYVQGQHASKQGAKAQARADKHTKHFWF